MELLVIAPLIVLFGILILSGMIQLRDNQQQLLKRIQKLEKK